MDDTAADARDRDTIARIRAGHMPHADIMAGAAAFDRSGIDRSTMDPATVELGETFLAARTAIVLADPVLIAFTALAEEDGDPDLMISRRTSMLPGRDQPHGVEQIMLHADDDLAFEREPILSFHVPTSGIAMGLVEDLVDAARHWPGGKYAPTPFGEKWDARREGCVIRLRMDAVPACDGLLNTDYDPDAAYLAEIVADTTGDHTRARIARLAHTHGTTTMVTIAKIAGIERMSVEGRIVEAIEDRLGVGHDGPLGARVARLERLTDAGPSRHGH